MVCEPCIPIAGSFRKPDIVASRGSKPCIIDMQVSGVCFTLSAAHKHECSHYGTPEVLQGVWELNGKDTVCITSATLNWQGAWCQESVSALQGTRAFILGPGGVLCESPNLDAFPLQDVVQEHRLSSHSPAVLHLVSTLGLAECVSSFV